MNEPENYLPPNPRLLGPERYAEPVPYSSIERKVFSRGKPYFSRRKRETSRRNLYPYYRERSERESWKFLHPPIEKLILELGSNNKSYRKSAAKGLGERKDGAAVFPLLKLLLKEKNPEVFEAALEALECISLTELQKKAYMNVLLGKLRIIGPWNWDLSKISSSSVYILVKMNDPQVLPGLNAVAFGGGRFDELDVMHVYWALGPAAIPSLMREVARIAALPNSFEKQRKLAFLSQVLEDLNLRMRQDGIRFSVPCVPRISGLVNVRMGDARRAFPGTAAFNRAGVGKATNTNPVSLNAR